MLTGGIKYTHNKLAGAEQIIFHFYCLYTFAHLCTLFLWNVFNPDPSSLSDRLGLFPIPVADIFTSKYNVYLYDAAVLLFYVTLCKWRAYFSYINQKATHNFGETPQIKLTKPTDMAFTEPADLTIPLSPSLYVLKRGRSVLDTNNAWGRPVTPSVPHSGSTVGTRKPTAPYQLSSLDRFKIKLSRYFSRNIRQFGRLYINLLLLLASLTFPSIIGLGLLLLFIAQTLFYQKQLLIFLPVSIVFVMVSVFTVNTLLVPGVSHIEVSHGPIQV